MALIKWKILLVLNGVFSEVPPGSREHQEFAQGAPEGGSSCHGIRDTGNTNIVKKVQGRKAEAGNWLPDLPEQTGRWQHTSPKPYKP